MSTDWKVTGSLCFRTGSLKNEFFYICKSFSYQSWLNTDMFPVKMEELLIGRQGASVRGNSSVTLDQSQELSRPSGSHPCKGVHPGLSVHHSPHQWATPWMSGLHRLSVKGIVFQVISSSLKRHRDYSNSCLTLNTQYRLCRWFSLEVLEDTLYHKDTLYL